MASDGITPQERPPIPAERERRRRRGRRWPRAVLAAVAVLGVVAVAVLLHRLSDVIRGSPVRAVLEDSADSAAPAVADPGFTAMAAALTGATLEPGNRIEILVDTVVFARMLADIDAARRSVTLQQYYCEPGRLGDRIADALAARARAGVRVLLLGDGFSCADWLRDVGPRLRSAGAEVATLRPVHWYALHRAQHRSHARAVVVDGAVAYTGGFGIDDKWIGSGPRAPPWHDVAVRVTGPAVAQMQGAFLAGWAEATGTLRVGRELWPALAAGDAGAAAAATDVGSVVAGLLVSEPGLGTSAAERYLALSLAAARRTLYLANSYFVPTPLLRRQLAAAARRGVDVRLLVPGRRTDLPSTRYAGRGFYGPLLDAGVRIWEYRPAMLHAKTLSADGVWGSVGSINLDNRSLRLNGETALLFHDARVGATLDSLFRADLGQADEITATRFRARSLWQKLVERVVRWVAPIL